VRFAYQNTARVTAVFMTATDHITGLPNLTLSVSLKKTGGDFAAAAPVVVDKGYGWYDVALTAADTDTLGDLVLHIEATGADPCDVLIPVVPVEFGVVADAVVIDVGTPNARIVDASGNQVSEITMAQTLALLLVTLCGDRSGIGTRTIIGSLPGVSGAAIAVDRNSQSTIQATLTMPGV